MRGFRSTIILLVIFLGLVGYIYFYESKRTPGQDPDLVKPRVFTVESDTIEEVSVRIAAGDPTVLKKVDGAWQITAPVATAADQNEATGLTTNLATVEIQRVVDENATDVSQYGLASPRIEIGFRAAGEQEMKVLQVGDKTATGADLYARLPSDSRVFLISSYLESTFNRSTFDLRDKTILKFERDTVDTIEIAAGQARTALSKAGTEWRLTAPVAARADTMTVDGLIGRLQVGQMKSIASSPDAAPDPARYGLDRPSVTVTLGSGSARATLAIGKEADPGTWYARDTAREMVFTVESALVDELKKDPGAFRPKDVFEFRPYSATRIEVTRNGRQEAFEKRKNAEGAETWHRVDPPGDVETSKMDSFLASLSGLSVDTYVEAATPTGNVVAEVFVTFEDGKKQERVTFSSLGPDVFATRPGEPGAGKFLASRLDDALKALDALK